MRWLLAEFRIPMFKCSPPAHPISFRLVSVRYMVRKLSTWFIAGSCTSRKSKFSFALPFHAFFVLSIK
jgi:hypothetical protein